MPVLAVTDAADPRIADYANVPDGVLLGERGLFVAEGRLVVRRLLAAARFATRSVMVTPAALEPVTGDAALPPDLPVYVVPPLVMNAITGFNLHRGALALGVRGDAVPLASVADGGRVLIALERVANADNVGGIFRNASAFGAAGIVIDAATTDPLYRKAIRTSVGTVLQVPFTRQRDFPAALRFLRASGFTTVALTPSADAITLHDCAPSLRRSRIVLVAGHEGEGLLPETLKMCDVRTRIPTRPGVDSLNVATAVAIALYSDSCLL